MIDAGHGDKDPGAVNLEAGRQEKDIALEVVLVLGNMLRDAGHNVLYTRDRDKYISPADRLKMIKSYQPDCFLSVHCNANKNPSASGVETIYRDEYDVELAHHVHIALVEHTGLKDRGVKQDIEDLGRRLAVLGGLETPACLVEIGFISNEEDLAVIEDENLIASALLEGIANWAEKTDD